MADADLKASARLPGVPGVAELVLIGQGGSGLIYRGRQAELGRDVAVKVLAAPPSTQTGLDRWQRELKAMGRLSNHPNIVAVYDSGLTAEGLPYLVMPFVADGSLGDRVRHDGPIAPGEAVTIGVKVASALTAAHEAGVLHRDVKPDNVLLSPYGPQLADFGIARLVDSNSNVTAIGQIHATINYAAPEVLAGEPASEQSDVYGLAATLYTAMQGEVPFPHAVDANAVAVAYQIMNEPVPDLHGTAVPRAIAEVLTRAMAKDPAERPRSAADLGDQLAAAMNATEDATVQVPVPVAGIGSITERIEPTTIDRVPTRPPVRQERAAQRRPGLAGGGISRALMVAVAVAVLIVAAALLSARTSHRDASPETGAPAASPTTVAGAASPRGTKPVVVAPAATTPVADGARRYFGALSRGDFGGAYAMLSPAFQAAQTEQSFVKFWRSASPVAIVGPVTATDLTANVPVRMGGGQHVYVLTFARGRDGKLYVDGPRPR